MQVERRTRDRLFFGLEYQCLIVSKRQHQLHTAKPNSMKNSFLKRLLYIRWFWSLTFKIQLFLILYKSFTALNTKVEDKIVYFLGKHIDRSLSILLYFPSKQTRTSDRSLLFNLC